MKVRDDVKNGIENLKKHFCLIESYNSMYSTNKKVAVAATRLYITILKAVEEVIGYYTQHICMYPFDQLIIKLLCHY